MAEKQLKATLVLKDKFTSVIKKADKATNTFSKSATKTTSTLKKVDSTARKTESSLKKLDKKHKVNIDTKAIDKAQSASKRLASDLRKVTGKKHNLKLNTAGAMSSVKALVGAVGALGVGVAAASTFGKGMEREKQRASMEHWIGDKPAADKYYKDASMRAQTSVGGYDSSMAASVRALQIASGNQSTADLYYAMSEDMASVSPGKTTNDAMEALADLATGEAERMKEFGFKTGKEQFDAAGGDITKIVDINGNTIADIFGGAAAALMKTDAFKAQVIKSSFERGMGEAGDSLLVALGPALDKVVPFAQTLADKAKPAMERLTSFVETKVTPVLRSAGEFIQTSIIPAMTKIWSVIETSVLPVLKRLWEFIEPLIQPVIDLTVSLVESLVPAVSEVCKWLMDYLQPNIQFVADTLSTLSSAIDLARGGLEKFFGWVSKDKPLNRGTERNAGGTYSFGGGLTSLHEQGGEIFDLPSGTRIYPAAESKRMMEPKGGNKAITVNINNTNNISSEVDADKVINKMASQLKLALANM